MGVAPPDCVVASDSGLYNDSTTKGHTVARTLTKKDISDYAKEIANTLEDYPDSDPAEVVEELVRIYSIEENMSQADEDLLRSEAWDMANTRRR